MKPGFINPFHYSFLFEARIESVRVFSGVHFFGAVYHPGTLKKNRIISDPAIHLINYRLFKFYSSNIP